MSFDDEMFKFEEGEPEDLNFTLDDTEEEVKPSKKKSKKEKNIETYDSEDRIKCTAKVDFILFPRGGRFEDSSNNFGILKMEIIDVEYGLLDLDKTGLITVKGQMPAVNYTDVYTIIAKEVIDPKWGKQYDLIYIGTPMKLDNEESQKIFLSKILTPIQLNALYSALPNPFISIQDEDVEALMKAKGIGLNTAMKIIDKYKETIDFSDAYVELDDYGITPKMIETLIYKYGSPQIVVEKIKKNPYILADEIDGIGFKKADTIALNAGIDPYSPFRIEAFMKYYLHQEAQRGNSYVMRKELMYQLKENIGQDIDLGELKVLLNQMIDENVLWKDDTRVALCYYHNLEDQIADDLLRILHGENRFEYNGWEEIIKNTENLQGWNYTEQQKKGIETVLKNQCVMITGYGGTGKSSIVKGMLDVFSGKYTYAMCALAGKASARLAEVTGEPENAYTIHRLLCFKPSAEGYFEYNRDNTLPYDIIIVDEASMIGGNLFDALIQAVETGAKLVMLCDIGQLESIGCLNIAKDIIESGVIPVVTLTEIHRQAQKSAIVTESLKVREGIQITDSVMFEEVEVRGELQDLTIHLQYDKTSTMPNVLSHFKEELPNAKSIMDIQVIVPMKERGDACTYNLNKELQEIYNPPCITKKEIALGAFKPYVLREGDKIINTRNNYKTYNTEGKKVPIFNGNVGIIKEINTENKYAIISFQFIGDIIVKSDHLIKIELGYAMTCHKSQGSEFDIAIVGLDISAYTMLTREWVYTAITRAKKQCIGCFEPYALKLAIEKSNVSIKQTFLQEFLQEMNEEKIEY